MPTVVLAGGGHAHVEVLRRFGQRRIEGRRLILISPDTHTAYSGMLPGRIAGHYTRDDCHIDLRPLCRRAGAEFIMTLVVGIDPAGRQVRCGNGQVLGFDALSLDVGSTPDLRRVPGAVEHAVPVKPVSAILDAWDKVAALVRHTIECATPHRGGRRRGGRSRNCAGDAASLPYCRHGTGARNRARDRRIPPDARALDAPPAGAGAGEASGRARAHGPRDAGHVRARLLHVRGSRPRGPRRVGYGRVGPLLARAERPAMRRSRVRRPSTIHLQSTSHPSVFAAGDVTTMVSGPLPKAGVFAVRQGPLLAENLRRFLVGDALRPYRPQRRFLSLISTGGRHAVASYGGLSWQGRWVWAWKDRIDRRFMQKYRGALMRQQPRRAT